MKNSNTKKISDEFFWLFVHPYVYVSVIKKKALLYNTLSAKLLEVNDNPEILSLVKKLNAVNNLYVIKIKKRKINKNILDFINELRKYFMGDIIKASLSAGRPVQFVPKLCLQKGSDIFLTYSKKARIKLLERDNLKNYLETLNLYVNETCNKNCKMCNSSYKQFVSCYKGSGNNELSAEQIEQILVETEGSKLRKINVCGGNIFTHSKFENIIRVLSDKRNIKKEYYVHFTNIAENINLLELLNEENSAINILLNAQFDNNVLSEMIATVKSIGIDFKVNCIVEDENDLVEFKDIIADSQIPTMITPFFNGKNLTFFEENVFVDKSDIEKSFPSMKEIFARKVLNRFNFGKITVRPNKNVYANLNHPGIGMIGLKDLFITISKELLNGTSWAKIRRNVEPCKGCTFKDLCPPISNYEYALGRYNLCEISQ